MNTGNIQVNKDNDKKYFTGEMADQYEKDKKKKEQQFNESSNGEEKIELFTE